MIPHRSSRSSAVLVATLLLGAPLLADSHGFDWAPYADADTVLVVTMQPDGTPRETTIWLAVLDGHGYIRTGGSDWGQEVGKNPAIELRIGEETLAVRAEFVEDDATREAIEAAFREKYGFQDALVGLFRGDRPKIMRVHPGADADAGASGAGEAGTP